MQKCEVFTNIQMDALMEFQNIGAGHSCVSLSKILDKTVLISTTKCCIIPTDGFLESMLMNNGTKVVAVYMKIGGDAEGAMLFMLEEKFGKYLYAKMNGLNSENVDILSSDFYSALKEIGQIMTGSFLSAVGDLLKIKLAYQLPKLSLGTPSNVMFEVCDDVFGDRDERVSLATNILDKTNDHMGSIAYIPKKKTANIILEKMKVR